MGLSLAELHRVCKEASLSYLRDIVLPRAVSRKRGEGGTGGASRGLEGGEQLLSEKEHINVLCSYISTALTLALTLTSHRSE